jgi:hypothetical protein
MQNESGTRESGLVRNGTRHWWAGAGRKSRETFTCFYDDLEGSGPPEIMRKYLVDVDGASARNGSAILDESYLAKSRQCTVRPHESSFVPPWAVVRKTNDWSKV